MVLREKLPYSFSSQDEIQMCRQPEWVEVEIKGMYQIEREVCPVGSSSTGGLREYSEPKCEARENELRDKETEIMTPKHWDPHVFS